MSDSVRLSGEISDLCLGAQICFTWLSALSSPPSSLCLFSQPQHKATIARIPRNRNVYE